MCCARLKYTPWASLIMHMHDRTNCTAVYWEGSASVHCKQKRSMNMNKGGFAYVTWMLLKGCQKKKKKPTLTYFLLQISTHLPTFFNFFYLFYTRGKSSRSGGSTFYAAGARARCWWYMWFCITVEGGDGWSENATQLLVLSPATLHHQRLTSLH